MQSKSADHPIAFQTSGGDVRGAQIRTLPIERREQMVTDPLQLIYCCAAPGCSLQEFLLKLPNHNFGDLSSHCKALPTHICTILQVPTHEVGRWSNIAGRTCRSPLHRNVLEAMQRRTSLQWDRKMRSEIGPSTGEIHSSSFVAEGTEG